MTDAVAAPLLEMRDITKRFARRHGAARSQPRGARWRDPRHLRRERRRQVHADEGAQRDLPARQLRGRDRLRRQPGDFKDIRSSERRGIGIIHQELALVPVLSIAENIFLGNEHASAGVISWHETMTARAEAARPGRPDGKPAHADLRHRRRQAAARRDRQGTVQEGEAADPRRADRGAQRRGQQAPARPDRRAPGSGPDLHHHLAQAQRGDADRGHHHDPARRPDHRDTGGRRRSHRGTHHPRHGGPRHGRPLSRAGRPPHRRRRVRHRGLDRLPSARPAAQGGRRRVHQRPARRGRRPRRPDGRRAAPSSR